MSIEFAVHKNVKLVEVRLSDYISSDEFLEGRKTLKELHLQLGIRKVLVGAMPGTKLSRKTPLVVLYREFHDDRLPLSIPFAVLIEKGIYPFLEYVESIAHHQGRAVKVFHAREDALAWLEVPQL